LDKPIEYEQTAPPWGSLLYTITNNKSQTIGVAGCGPTSAAMVAATLRDETITPKDAADFAVRYGYRTANDGTKWTYFGAFLGALKIPYKQTSSADEAVAALKKGLMVICAAGKGIWTSGGHIFLAYGLTSDGKKVYIHDPNSEAQYRELANISNFRNEVVQFWIIEEDWRSKMIVQKKTVEVFNEAGKASKLNGVYGEQTNYIAIREVEKIVPWAIKYDAETNRVIILPNIKQ